MPAFRRRRTRGGKIYDRTVVQGTWSAAHNLYRFDARVVDGAVHSGPFLARTAGNLGRFSTTGNVRHYALYFFAGVLFLFWWLVR